MRFMIRCDDLGLTPESAETPSGKARDKGLGLARRFHAAMQGVPFLGATIPGEVDAEGVEWIRSRPAGLTVALHGYRHATLVQRNEFLNESSAFIREKIAEAQRRIGPTKFYVPPHNQIDAEHIEPLWHEGIRYVFGREQEWPTPPSPVEMARGVMFYPAWSTLYGATAWTQGSATEPLLDVLPKIEHAEGKAVMTLHLPWQSAKDPDFLSVRVMAARYGHMFVSAEEFVK